MLPEEKIVAIDEPSFLEPAQVRDLADAEPVLSVSVWDDVRAYPLRYLIFHEIVNDVVGGDPLVVSYCPLCNTGIAFRRPHVGGEILDFGVSGRLLNGNLVMIDRLSIEPTPRGFVDRETSGRWTIFGGARSGPMRGARLEPVLAVDHLWFDWTAFHPDARVIGVR